MTHENAPPPEDWTLPPRHCGEWLDGVWCHVCGEFVPPNLGQE